MAHSLHRKKRIRQNLKRKLRNRARRSTLKTKIRTCREAILHGTPEQAQKLYRDVCKALDRAANLGTVHRNEAARRKSRLAKRINSLQTKPA